LRPGKYGTEHIINKYWGFDPGKRIRYRSDAEYQEHFLCVFSTAVQRRLRSDRPVLAELSGGMDSSSIVCMADLIMGVGAQESTRHSYLTSSSVECPRLDTISCFGDFYEHLEPDTNDFPWISKVEQKRGRIGFHINLSQMRYKETRSLRPIMSAFDSGGFASTPAPRTLSNFFKLYAAHMVSQGYRVTISGVGGDHVTGREPTPLPELQSLLVRGRFVRLVLQLNAWASKVNKSHLSLLWEAVQGFFPTKNLARDIFAAPWFRSEFIRRNRATLCGSPTRVKFLGHQPSFQHSLAGLDGERKLAACWDPNPHLLREVRYPYLDRDFLSFMYAIPRDQIVRVGQHRFVMKRSLVGIVPDELLNRERKAFRRAESEKVKERDGVAQVLGSVTITEQMVASLIQIIDSNLLLEALQNVSAREEARIHMLVLTLKLESWLRHLASHGIVAHAQPTRGASAFVDDEASRTIPSIQSSAC
jgi:asparagine synthase (glutamine-hydrolysing)